MTWPANASASSSAVFFPPLAVTRFPLVRLRHDARSTPRMAPSRGTQAYSACPPNRTPGIAITSSPALNLATSAPTASTTPATSSPGRGGENRTPRAGEPGAAYRATSGYQDLADFAEGISDERARRRLARAIRGNGAFCQFKDKLHEEDPRLLPVWHAFLAARAERRAVYWLVDDSFVDHDQAARFPDQATPTSPDQQRKKGCRIQGFGFPTSAIYVVPNTLSDLLVLFVGFSLVAASSNCDRAAAPAAPRDDRLGVLVLH
jgi:hypothetical protein